jgi:tRNA modification GTPase
LRLIDTAGFNLAPSPLEKRGIEKTLEQAAEADLFLWVIDATRPVPDLPPAVAARLTPANTIAVFNKTDLPSAARGPLSQNFPVVKICALDGAGIEDLQTVIARLADSFQVETGDELIAINARHSHALVQAQEALESAGQKLSDKTDTELVASDLRCALDAFGEISGKVDNEKILDRLFATFCIGK